MDDRTSLLVCYTIRYHKALILKVRWFKPTVLPYTLTIKAFDHGALIRKNVSLDSLTLTIPSINSSKSISDSRFSSVKGLVIKGLVSLNLGSENRDQMEMKIQREIRQVTSRVTTS